MSHRLCFLKLCKRVVLPENWTQVLFLKGGWTRVQWLRCHAGWPLLSACGMCGVEFSGFESWCFLWLQLPIGIQLMYTWGGSRQMVPLLVSLHPHGELRLILRCVALAWLGSSSHRYLGKDLTHGRYPGLSVSSIFLSKNIYIKVFLLLLLFFEIRTLSCSSLPGLHSIPEMQIYHSSQQLLLWFSQFSRLRWAGKEWKNLLKVVRQESEKHCAGQSSRSGNILFST